MEVHKQLRLELFAAGLDNELRIVRDAARHLEQAVAFAFDEECRIDCRLVDAVRSDFLAPGGPYIPDAVRTHRLVPGTVRDYSGRFYQGGKRLVVLSPLVDLVQPGFRHREWDCRFFPLSGCRSTWTQEQQTWFAAAFRAEPPPDIDAALRHWRAIVTAIQEQTGIPIFLCNIFRHVTGRPPEWPEAAREMALIQRIRHYNRMLADLAHETGSYVLDLDRILSEQGGRPLHTDYRLDGSTVIPMAARGLVSQFFQIGLDDYLCTED